MNIIQIGAGKIGRGLLSQLYYEGSHEITYVDKDKILVDELNNRRQYVLRLTTKDTVEDITIKNFKAIHTDNHDTIRDAFIHADMAAVSVGVNELQNVAETIALGIHQRAMTHKPPLDIFIAENQIHSAPILQGHIIPYLNAESMNYFFSSVGLVEAVVGRMVPIPPESLRETDPLLIISEPYRDLPCSHSQMLNPPPAIPGFISVDNIEAYEARKLFIHNALHASIAYLGYGRYTYIWECMDDKAIVDTCMGIVNEVSSALSISYGFVLDDLNEYSSEIIERMRNRHLSDTITRVAGDPIRKLRKNDRLIGSALLCLDNRIKPNALLKAILAAFSYDNPNDPSAVQMQDVIKARGITGFLSIYCGVSNDSLLSKMILSH
jgi:mannitol-1-phosphate 5-dehydrogenase